MMWNVRYFMAGLCATGITSAAFGATTLVNQTFDESGYTRNMSSPPAGLLDYYFRSGSGSVGLVNDSVIGGNNALQLLATTPGGNVRGFSSSNFSATALTNVGDQLTISFDLRFATLPTNAQDAYHGALRLGIYNSVGTQVGADFDGKFNNDTGYCYAIAAGGDANQISGVNLKRDYNGGGTLDVLGGDYGIGGTASSSALIHDTAKHTVQITVKRQANGVELILTVDNATWVDATDSNTTTGNGYVTTFDNIQIGALSNSDFDMRLDNLVITTNVTPVPEAATVSMLAVGAIALLTRKK